MNNGGSSRKGDASIEVSIPTNTMFQPQSSILSIEKSSGSITLDDPKPAPEKRLTLFALRLATLEKAATGLGTLGFIWATVVLLGGFAITLEKTDFWFITTILLTEATRIYGRSHEVEWQHQATWSLVAAGRDSFRLLRSSSRFLMRLIKSIFKPNPPTGSKNRDISDQRQPMDVPLLPYAEWVFVSKNASKILTWLQILAAIACVVLSLIKLIRHDYGEVDGEEKRNRKAALIIFYSLALAEASLFLLEKAYWEIQIIYCKLLEEVSKECDLQGREGIAAVKRFFYDAYSRCLDGSVFDGLKMDMVSFAMELLVSDTNSYEEQLIGARILCKFSTNERFSDDTLQKIGVTIIVMERLVEILNWKNIKQEEMRQSAAVILNKLTSKKQNSLRVAGIPAAMESISSLLYTNRSQRPDGIAERTNIDHSHYDYWNFNQLALQLLKKLARDHDNCGKIGNTRGLLPKIISSTQAGERILKDETIPTSQILAIKRSLQVVRMLASTTGATGKQLRRDLSENVFTISNIRDVLRHGDKHPKLQHLGIEILRNLAMEVDATEMIGGTGGILKELLKIFFREGNAEDENLVRIAAGEALAMLALESKSNCVRILRAGALKELVMSLDVPLLRENAGRILRNLCTYSGDDSFIKLREVVAGVPTVLEGMRSEDAKLQEVMVGLAASAFRFMTPVESRAIAERARVTLADLAHTIVQILNKYPDPPTRVPRVRRFTIELAIWLMTTHESSIDLFKNLELEKELQNVLDTTSELESFSIFSGTVGSSRCRTNMHALVESALDLMNYTYIHDTNTVCTF